MPGTLTALNYSDLGAQPWLQTVLEQGGQFAGINRKVQLKPLRWSAPEERSGEQPRCVEALLILKHGGVLTHSGRQQAETLGNLFRNVMYPPSAGGGLLRLHSTYRHDLKIYSSGGIGVKMRGWVGGRHVSNVGHRAGCCLQMRAACRPAQLPSRKGCWTWRGPR